MSKFLLSLLLQFSKALVNSKIQFLIRKFIFPDFRPGRPRGPLGRWPNWPAGLSPLPQAEAHRPAQITQPAYDFGVFYRIRFLLRFTPFQAGRLPLVSLTTGSHLSAPSSPSRRPTPVGISPRRRFPRAAASHLGCPRAFTALPHHFPLLIPFKPSVNGP